MTEARGTVKYICENCKKEYEEKLKKCPSCGKKLKVALDEDEQKEIQKQNNDFTVISTMMM